MVETTVLQKFAHMYICNTVIKFWKIFTWWKHTDFDVILQKRRSKIWHKSKQKLVETFWCVTHEKLRKEKKINWYYSRCYLINVLFSPVTCARNWWTRKIFDESLSADIDNLITYAGNNRSFCGYRNAGIISNNNIFIVDITPVKYKRKCLGYRFSVCVSILLESCICCWIPQVHANKTIYLNNNIE